MKIITQVHQITETSQTYMSHVTTGSRAQCVFAVPEKKFSKAMTDSSSKYCLCHHSEAVRNYEALSPCFCFCCTIQMCKSPSLQNLIATLYFGITMATPRLH